MNPESIIRAVENQRNIFMNENIRLQVVIEEQQRVIEELRKQITVDADTAKET